MRQAFSYRDDPNVPAFADENPVIIFDGYCALCSGWAALVLRRDKRKRFRLVTAQSELGTALYVHYGLNPDNYETNILIEDGLPWLKSEGTIRMVTGLGGPWRTFAVFRILPTRVRDWLYDAIARNRLRLTGKRETCYIPTAEYADRFLS